MYIKPYGVPAAHYTCGVQAGVLAAESARRDASNLSASSTLLTSLKLRREVGRVFEQHSLADTGAAYDSNFIHKALEAPCIWLVCRQELNGTSEAMLCNAGFLTRAQLQAALHSLGLLASKPPAFSSSMHRTAAALPSTPSVCHSRQEGDIVNSLWQLLTGTQSNRTKVSPSPPSKKSAGLTCLQLDEAAANQADSCDTLLCESIDQWQQLIGEKPLSIEVAHAMNSQTPAHASASNATKHGSGSPLPVPSAESMYLTSDQPAQQKLPSQLKEGIKSAMHGISLQQLLAFVQHVQQHSCDIQPVPTAAFLQAALTDCQNAELDKIARKCSQNKLANMTYVGIGNKRVQQHLPLQLKSAHGRVSGSSACHPKAHSQHSYLTKKWQPQGELVLC